MTHRLTRRSMLLALAAAPVTALEGYRTAKPGYRFEFPRDHFSHPEFRTEWWYYTANLRSGGRRFGCELTFFRQAVEPRNAGKPQDAGASAWAVDDIYLAHLALSDLDGGRFLHTERLNRSGPGLAGASFEQKRIWNGNWNSAWDAGDRQSLQAVTPEFLLQLDLDPLKPPVIHGVDGISRKSAGEGEASHYISFTRLAAAGTLDYDGRKWPLEGLAWMDHEFFTHELAADQLGWDWLYVQFEDLSELMCYQLRRKDGSADAYSSGTWIPASGPARHLRAEDYRLTPGKTWKSPVTGAAYPVEWRVEVPSLELDVTGRTPLPDQELVSRNQIGPTYWEGAMHFEGKQRGRPASGPGYLEMTGYSGKVRFGEARAR